MNLIIPYRNRKAHLAQFMNHYRGEFDIYIVEQADDKPFNRARLLNIGFIESDITEHYIFHDVDMIAVDKSIYAPAEVAHLAGRASQFNYKDPYIAMGIQGKYFGGVNLFSHDAFIKCDGYSNEFWGWGSEDDEMYNQVVKSGFEVEFRPGRFRCLNHPRADMSFHPKNILKNLQNTSEGRGDDGLHSTKYELISKVKSENYTWVKVKI